MDFHNLRLPPAILSNRPSFHLSQAANRPRIQTCPKYLRTSDLIHDVLPHLAQSLDVRTRQVKILKRGRHGIAYFQKAPTIQIQSQKREERQKRIVILDSIKVEEPPQRSQQKKLTLKSILSH